MKKLFQLTVFFHMVDYIGIFLKLLTSRRARHWTLDTGQWQNKSRTNSEVINELFPTTDTRQSANNIERQRLSTIYCTIDTQKLTHCEDTIKKIRKNIPEKELRDHSPNSYLHVSESDLYCIPTDLPILLQENREPFVGIFRSLKDTRMWKLGLRPRNFFSVNT